MLRFVLEILYLSDPKDTSVCICDYFDELDRASSFQFGMLQRAFSEFCQCGDLIHLLVDLTIQFTGSSPFDVSSNAHHWIDFIAHHLCCDIIVYGINSATRSIFPEIASTFNLGEHITLLYKPNSRHNGT